MDALGTDHAPISHIRFYWGRYCPDDLSGCPAVDPTVVGTVIFTFESRITGMTTDSAVTVVREDDGTVHASSPMPIPSPG